MRTAFIEQLTAEAKVNPRIFLVVGDLGYSVVEPFKKEFPTRYLNAGVAEQNMTGLAAGLASEGYHVFTYSIGNFPTLRCLEQIRNDVCYHRFAVTVVAVGAGMSYGNQGYSHHCVQDLACLRCLPNMTILSPADPGETRHCVKWLCLNPQPSYLRIGKATEKKIHSRIPMLDEPTLIVDNSGDVAILGTGSILVEAVSAARKLLELGVGVDVYSLTRIATHLPLDLSRLSRYRTVLTLEEHVAAGGVGEMVRAILHSHSDLRSLSIPDELCYESGTQEHLREIAGVDAAAIVRIFAGDASR